MDFVAMFWEGKESLLILDEKEGGRGLGENDRLLWRFIPPHFFDMLDIILTYCQDFWVDGNSHVSKELIHY